MFGGDPYRGGTDKSEREMDRAARVVCFITVAGFLNGPGFQKMRADLRRDADEILVIDCSPEGHQPPSARRIFQGVQQPVCIVLRAARSAAEGRAPARCASAACPRAPREEKFGRWPGSTSKTRLGRRAERMARAFPAAGAADWVGYPALEDLFQYNGSGVMAGRTWVIAPDAAIVDRRWKTFVTRRRRQKKGEALPSA